MNTSLPSVTATPEQRAAVKQWHLIAPGIGSETTVTGVLVSQGQDDITVRLYSAGCLHDLHTFDRADVIRVEDDPR